MRGKFAAWRGNKKNKRQAVTAAVLIVVALLFGLGKTLSGPANGSINNSANLTANPSAPTPKEIKVEGKYISFSYLDTFRPLPTEKPSGNMLESFDYVTKHSPFWELAVSLSSLPSDNPADNGSYNTRAADHGRYKLETWPVKGASVPVFSDEKEPYSKVAFLTHSGKLLTLALSGSGDKNKMQTEQLRILNSTEWKD